MLALPVIVALAAGGQTSSIEWAEIRAAAEAQVDCNKRRVRGVCRARPGDQDVPVLLVDRQTDIAEVQREFRSFYQRRLLQSMDPEMFEKMQVFDDTVEYWIIGEVKSLQDEVPVEPDIVGKKRGPAKIGTSIGYRNGDAGTLGCRVKSKQDPKRVYLLSNWHVLTPSDHDCEGVKIFHPSDRDSRRRRNKQIATVSRCKGVRFRKNPDDRLEPYPENDMDAAIAETTPGCVGTSTKRTRDAPSYTPDRKLKAATDVVNVKKFGRTTDLTHGSIRCTDAIVCVDYSGTRALFVNQVVIASDPGRDPFCDSGDSGSLVVSEEGDSPVGLLFARNFNVTVKKPRVEPGPFFWPPQLPERNVMELDAACFASPIEPVLKELGVEIDDTPEVAEGAGDCVPPKSD